MRLRSFLPIVLCATALGACTASAQEENPYYSTKQPYSPRQDYAEYSPAPNGFQQIYTTTVNRHGSRGLSSFKYDDLAAQMLRSAEESGDLTDLGHDLIAQVAAMTKVNQELSGGPGQESGYGNLTTLGREELRGIGQRNAERNAEFFATLNDDPAARLSFTSSGEDRATDSGWNFGSGLLDTAPTLREHTDYDSTAQHVDIAANTALLYAHKDKSLPSYERYQEWKKSDTLEEKIEHAYTQPQAQEAARGLLSHIFQPSFIDSLEAGELTFTGSEDESKEVTGLVEAALPFYNLYLSAPALSEETSTPAEGWIFHRYIDDSTGPTLAYLLDVEDYYQKGPAIEGQTVAYDNYEPLLEDMLARVEERAAGGDNAADFRFGHAETIIPLAALLRLPGSEHGTPANEVMDYENSDWRGEAVSPMAANIQWDAFQNQSGEVVVRMLYNERATPFHEGCTPMEPQSAFYRLEELQGCLPLE
ncbi:histidine-type phosphatase [Corynebacterium lowii]|uniref:Multiple inositol polyphosphate phosphatase 1 n=1 Tax=Corynebacterium lowii TaxID=1544413 RepID=A0A0Q1DUY7_9CORY|nr:histidine-type phosphatase [Corynebacterium lowii]KQB83947.1 Histidine phosphatase superfamily (branch 2) [Corynebacterium lowii]MDP9852804.1 hypothetical protein [Corynebacterium lowii]